MNFRFFVLGLMVLFIIPIVSDTYAQTTYDVNIPTGAASPDAPYFWQSEKDGSTNGDVAISPGDTILWKNADTAAHTVTSGNVETGPDDLFDSSLFGPGKTFSHTFTETGNFDYYCLLHPWMDGTIMVTVGYSIIPNVGKQAGDGSTYFDVEYDFNRLLDKPTIDTEQKSITFEIIGQPQSENKDLELRLPSELIDGNFVIWIDGEKLSDFDQVRDGDFNVVLLSVEHDSKLLTIMGTSVVPEFGTMGIMILLFSIISVIILSQNSRIQIKF
ncbi:MAG: plastocyanin/azurin family copper-binding protein [Candidatus Nitrosopumilus sp. bin_7KS]